MRSGWFLIIFGFSLAAIATCGIIVNEVKMSVRSGYGSTGSDFTNKTGEQLANIYLNLTKELNFKIMVMFKIFKIENNKKTKLIDIPKLNYCQMRRAGSLIPMLSKMIDEVANYGNLAQPCPLKPNTYYIKDYPVERSIMASFFPIGAYFGTLQVVDENRKPVLVWSVETNFKRVL